MSWPSFYGYKYTPIGLRQREVKDESGAKTYSTTVHLPLGGHLLDIERRFNPDGSVSKRETSCYNPDIPECRCAPSPVRTIPRAVDPLFADEFRSPHFSDLERQADDIIANFRARQGTTGIERQFASAQQTSRQQAISSSRKLVSSSEITRSEESALTSSRV
ncbi:hypothetical protein Anas_08156, partial [Armadillidium nasatum]